MNRENPENKAYEKIKKGETTTYDKLLPTYLRMSQAERELKEKSE